MDYSTKQEENMTMKAIKMTALAMAVCLGMTACSSDENEAQPKQEELVFTGYIDQDATRTSIDATTGKVSWVAGDEVTIGGVKYVATPDASDATKATFTKKSGETGTPSVDTDSRLSCIL